MLKFKNLRRNLLAVLVMVAVFPMAFQRPVAVFVCAQGFYSNAAVSVSRSVHRSYGQTFLHQINSQALESFRKNAELKTGKLYFWGFPENSARFPNLVKSVFANMGGNFCSLDRFIPLRI